MFAVETNTICDGWVNCWHEDGELLLFDTEAEAQKELDDHLADTMKAFQAGDMDEPAYPEHFRIVPVNEE